VRVPAETIELEELSKRMRLAGLVLLEVESHDRWGPPAGAANEDKRGLRARLDAKEAEGEQAALLATLRVQQPDAVEAWVEAHLELIDEQLARPDTSGTATSVLKQEREEWQRLRTGQQERVRQNSSYVSYCPKLYLSIFGIAWR
jgi:hypothetical protein